MGINLADLHSVLSFLTSTTECLCPRSSRRLLETENLESQTVGDGAVSLVRESRLLMIPDLGVRVCLAIGHQRS